VVLTPLSFHLTPDEHPFIRGPAVLPSDGVTAGSGPFNLRTSSSTLQHPSRTRGQHAPRLLAPWLPPTPSHDTHSHPNIHSPHTWRTRRGVIQSVSHSLDCAGKIALRPYPSPHITPPNQTHRLAGPFSTAKRETQSSHLPSMLTKFLAPFRRCGFLPALWSFRLIAVSFLL
jgi:hypothetical protein